MIYVTKQTAPSSGSTGQAGAQPSPDAAGVFVPIHISAEQMDEAEAVHTFGSSFSTHLSMLLKPSSI